MTPDPQRLGPWLRGRQPEPERTWRDRAVPILVGAGAVVVFGIVVIVVLKFLFRYPGPTIGVLAVVWLVGFVLSQILRQRDRSGRGGGG